MTLLLSSVATTVLGLIQNYVLLEFFLDTLVFQTSFLFFYMEHPVLFCKL